MANQIVWCDIPVLDLKRAVKFYVAVLGQPVQTHELSGATVGILPHEDGEVGGCLVAGERKSTGEGVLIYLNVNGRLDQALAAVTAHGGKVVETKRPIGPFGFRAIVIDSEGNRVALHSD